ncbi:MAG TPA: amidohydrolase family protein [Stellaceae bacterium]|nr:amidohydrolase family protein [Stellaceae bacterium]
MRIIDGDGHVMEDGAAIRKFLPPDMVGLRELFPPLDHFHVFVGETPPGSFRRDVGPKEWIEFLDDLGIESTVLYPTWGLAYGRIFHRDWAIAATRAYNDWIHEQYLTKSPRFQAVALIPMQDPAEAAKELRRAVRELGFCGAMLPSTGLSDQLGAKEYWPVYEEADRLACALAVHGGSHSGLGMDHMNVYTPVQALGHPLGLVINYGGMLFNGVFDRFPNARYGFMEGGVAWALMAQERFERAHQTHIQYNPRGELMPAWDQSVADYVRRHVREGRLFFGCEGDEPLMAQAIRELGSGAFVYSSDFPHEVNNATCKKEIAAFLDNRDIADADKAAVMHGNAQRFYGLSQARAASSAA